jgi:predicted membrane-bound mannosyltransferase
MFFGEKKKENNNPVIQMHQTLKRWRYTQENVNKIIRYTQENVNKIIRYTQENVNKIIRYTQENVNKIIRAVVMGVWKFDLQLPMQSVTITTNAVSSNRVQGEVYSIQRYVIRFVGYSGVLGQ